MSSNRQQKVNKSMDTLFPQSSDSACRVCADDVVDGRWNYCSVRCRTIARAVQRMFIWDVVREQVLERDSYTCQNCGWSQSAHQDRLTEARHAGQMDRHEQLMTEKRTLEVDHIHRLADGGHPLDESNLQTLCEDCHTQKTAKENSTDSKQPDITLDAYLKESQDT